MKYYAKIEDGIIKEYAKKEDVDSGSILVNYSEVIDYEPQWFNGIGYTKEKFEEIKNSQEYKNFINSENKRVFDYELKQLEDDSSIIEYQGKKISLEEILFKSLIYTSVSDLYVYLKTVDKEIIKISRTSFLLMVTKAKSNLKDTEEALYNAVNNYDPSKDNLALLKNALNNINKIFNS